jgi:hypothetical protein
MADIGPIRGRRFGRMYGRFDRTASPRLRQLLLAGLCRGIGTDLSPVVTHAIETVEQVADEAEPALHLVRALAALDRELNRLSKDRPAASRRPRRPPDLAHLLARSQWSLSARVLACAVSKPTDLWEPFVILRDAPMNEGTLANTNEQRQLLRDRLTRVLTDLVVTTLGPISFDPRWRTSDVLGLARGIYEDRAFDRMPILADALMDAGCERARIIDHCRESGPHYRGCWVVDAVLGLR